MIFEVPKPQVQGRPSNKRELLSKLSDAQLISGLTETPNLGTAEYTMLFAEALARLLRRKQ